MAETVRSNSRVNPTPYSLGKLIDWKRGYSSAFGAGALPSPYSLGKLIDWKRGD